MSKVLKIKHEGTGDIRRVSLNAWPDLASLDVTLLKLFGNALPTPYILRYRDEDGDLVSITSSLELREAAAAVERSATPGRAVLSLLLGTPSEGMSSIIMSPASAAASSAASASSSFSPSRAVSGAPAPARALLPTLDSMSLPPMVVQDGRAVPAHSSPLFIDAVAPADFKSAMSRLMQRGYGWEQARDALVDFGGQFEQALGALEQSGPRASPPGRAYFLPSFRRSIEQLEAAGFPREVSIGALIRNGGVAANAALELAGVFQQEVCSKGHLLEVSSYSLGNYKSGWYCDRCRKNDHPGQRWHCRLCAFDVCFGCLPAPQTAAAGKAAAQLTGGVASSTAARAIDAPRREAEQAQQLAIRDNSMPASLLVPVRQLEAMGFADRMRNIELLVKNDHNLTHVAVQLADERRRDEEKEEAKRRAEEQLRKAEAERRRRAAEARRRREEERRRREEEKARRQMEAKRRQAANSIVKSPEKLAMDIEHLTKMGFSPLLATTSLVNNGGDVEAALEELLGANN